MKKEKLQINALDCFSSWICEYQLCLAPAKCAHLAFSRHSANKIQNVFHINSEPVQTTFKELRFSLIHCRAVVPKLPRVGIHYLLPQLTATHLTLLNQQNIDEGNKIILSFKLSNVHEKDNLAILRNGLDINFNL